MLNQWSEIFHYLPNVKNTTELIKNIENNIKKLNVDVQLNIRNQSIPIIRNLLSISAYRNNINAKLSNLFNETFY